MRGPKGPTLLGLCDQRPGRTSTQTSAPPDGGPHALVDESVKASTSRWATSRRPVGTRSRWAAAVTERG